MPLYEYVCLSCQTKFTLLRPMSAANEPAECPDGHGRAPRVLSVFASFSRDEGGALMPMAGDGGCACGGACSCSA
jgi:putative FmdB family regulatory protein